MIQVRQCAQVERGRPTAAAGENDSAIGINESGGFSPFGMIAPPSRGVRVGLRRL